MLWRASLPSASNRPATGPGGCHRFAPGHRIRLQVSSGAHPRYARNPGTGEDPATATALEPVDLEVLRGAQHSSVLILPRGPDTGARPPSGAEIPAHG